MTIKQIDEKIKEIEDKINDTHLCENTVLVYTRITGYYRPTEFYNDGKKQEFTERLEYNI